MGISLKKGQKISLKKEGEAGLSRITMGLGWDVARKKGLLGMLGAKAPDIDLDASCLMFDEKGVFFDVVYFGQLRSKCGSIAHTGDNLTGAGDGDDEQIKVNLNNVPSEVKSLVFTVSSYRGQTFETVENAFCRLLDEGKNEEIARYDLSAQGQHTAQIMIKVYRHNGEWKAHAIGDTCQARTFKDMIQPIFPHL